MAGQSYLLQLADRLASGLRSMEPGRRDRHRRFVLSCQMSDGGFAGREGDADLYYTGFAVRVLVMLGGLRQEEARRVGRFIASHQPQRLSVVDLLSALYSGLVVQLVIGADPFADLESGWIEAVVEKLENLRTRDGGYAKSAEGAAGSTYHSFLVMLVYELLGRRLPHPDDLVQFVYDRQRDDGGFVEIAPMKRSGTNPTAAAVAILQKFDAVDEELREDVGGYLSEVRSGEGGFQANTRIPFADGLSTFTAMLTAQNLGLNDLIAAETIERFLTDPHAGLELPTGGFRGAAWDDRGDVEYTFYGLGCLALLQSAAAR